MIFPLKLSTSVADLWHFGTGILLITFWMYAYIYIFFKDKKSQNGRNQSFPYRTIFAWLQKDSDPDLYFWLTDPDLGGPKTYGSATLLSTQDTGIKQLTCFQIQNSCAMVADPYLFWIVVWTPTPEPTLNWLGHEMEFKYFDKNGYFFRSK